MEGTLGHPHEARGQGRGGEGVTAMLSEFEGQLGAKDKELLALIGTAREQNARAT